MGRSRVLYDVAAHSIVLCAFGLLALTGCGGGGESNTPTHPAPQAPSPDPASPTDSDAEPIPPPPAAEEPPASAAPPDGAGTAVLSWTAPTSNVDGSVLANLAGYRILHGASEVALDQLIEIANPGLTTYVVENLAAGTWYFAVRAYTDKGVESSLSNIASKAIE